MEILMDGFMGFINQLTSLGGTMLYSHLIGHCGTPWDRGHLFCSMSSSGKFKDAARAEMRT